MLRGDLRLKDDILKEVLRLLNERYPQGLYEWLFKYHRAEYDEVFALVDEIDNVYKTGTVSELKAVLRQYWHLHIEAIQQFEDVVRLDFDINEARRELNEERAQA